MAAYFGVKLNFPYKKYPAASTLGGFFYAASLSVNIALPLANSRPSKRFDAVIDSGASGCLFHASIGRAIGLQIEKGVVASTLGVAGPSKMYLHDVSLYIPGGIIIARAGFSDDLPIAGLLGMTGFFEHFKITFDATLLCCELERLYRA